MNKNSYANAIYTLPLRSVRAISNDWVTPNPDFKVISLLDAKYNRND